MIGLTGWMNIRNIKLIKRSQVQRNASCMILYVWIPRTGKTSVWWWKAELCLPVEGSMVIDLLKGAWENLMNWCIILYLDWNRYTFIETDLCIVCKFCDNKYSACRITLKWSHGAKFWYLGIFPCWRNDLKSFIFLQSNYQMLYGT